MPKIYRRFTTRTGCQIWLRPLGADDARYLVDLFDNLSPQSRYLRFRELLNSASPDRVQAEAQEIARNAPLKGQGWLAFVQRSRQPKMAVGGVRWVRVEPETAEIALTVRDDFQGQGIGREMLLTAVLDARTAGIKKIIAFFHGANQSVSQLLRNSPVPVQRSIHAGEISIEVDLTHPGWDAVHLQSAA